MPGWLRSSSVPTPPHFAAAPAPVGIHGSWRGRGTVLAYLVLLAVAEVCVLWSAPVGVVCHGAVLLALLNHYIFAVPPAPMNAHRGAPVDRHLSTLPVLGLLPVLRIATLTMPNNEASPIFWYALVGLPLVLGVVLTARLVDARPADLGIRWTRAQPAGALIGMPLGFAAFELQQAGPVIRSEDWRYLAAGSVVLLLLGGVEEVVFRGMIQRSLCQVFGLSGILLTAVLSTVAASGSGSLSFVAFSGGVAVVFGFLVQTTGSLVGVAVAHGVINAMALLLLTNLSPVSGR